MILRKRLQGILDTMRDGSQLTGTIKKPLSKNRKGHYKIPGDDLLSHASLPRSTIGATRLNFRVRDGIGCNSCAMITGENFRELMQIFNRSKKIDKAFRPISTTQLNTLLYLHLWPINVVVYNEPYYQKIGRTNLRTGFALICFQRLSFPNIATQRCF